MMANDGKGERERESSDGRPYGTTTATNAFWRIVFVGCCFAACSQLCALQAPLPVSWFLVWGERGGNGTTLAGARWQESHMAGMDRKDFTNQRHCPFVRAGLGHSSVLKGNMVLQLVHCMEYSMHILNVVSCVWKVGDELCGGGVRCGQHRIV